MFSARLVIHRMSNSTGSPADDSALGRLSIIWFARPRKLGGPSLLTWLANFEWKLVVFAISLCDVCPASFPTLLNYEDDDARAEKLEAARGLAERCEEETSPAGPAERAQEPGVHFQRK